MSNDKCKMIDDKCPGFTLVEILVVLVITGFFLAMTSRLFTGHNDQERFDENRKKMIEIREAILGPPGAYVNGQRQFMGYVSDMGGLPALNEQPKALWEQGGLPSWSYQGDDSRIWCGWHGPYIEAPGGVLNDGWGNAFQFTRFDETDPDTGQPVAIDDGMNMRITSLGADGKEGGNGFDEDIEYKILRTEYTGAVAGQATGVNQVTIYYPGDGVAQPRPVRPDSSGYFRFEGGATGEGALDIDIPMGARSIKITGGSEELYVFSVEPTGNWLGTLKVEVPYWESYYWEPDDYDDASHISSLFSAAWGKKWGEEGYDPLIDFNKDGQVGMPDRYIWRHYIWQP